MMNILILSLKGPTTHEGGAGEVIRRLSKEWVKMGHSVKIITTKPNTNYPTYEEIDGFEVIRVGSIYTAVFHISKTLFEKHYNEWADIVIENMTSYPLFTPIYTKPSLVITHSIKRKIYFKTQPFWKALIGFLSENLLPLIYRNVKFVAVSDATRRDLINIGIKPSQVKVIPNGVDADVFIPSQKNYYPTILYLGKLDKHKNVRDMIIAFKYIVEKHPKAELLIAGDGPEIQILKKMARNISNIKFLSFVDGSNKTKLYQKAWIYVLPSLKEGFPLSFLEANSCGTPIITYDVPGTEYVENYKNGIRVKDKNPLSLANAITYIIENPDILIKMSQYCRRKALKYSWEKIARMYLRYIRGDVE